MRFHRHYAFLQTWMASERLRSIVTADNLAVARFEPTVHFATGGAFLDLVFFDGDAIAVLPLLEVTPQMLLERELTPLIWPAACAALPRERLEALEAQIIPWLESLAFARQLNREVIRMFSSRRAYELFERARAAKLLGAATYTQTIEASAPYVYAMRFADGKRVRIADPDGGTGAAVMATRADVRADLQNPELNALARTWFGANIFGNADGGCDVAVCAHGVSVPDAPIRIVLDECPAGARLVHVARPVPADVMFSYDPDDSTAARSFGVFTAAERAIRDRFDGGAPVAGGSAGRILLLVRENWQSMPDADVDEACALAERLRAEGFTVRVCGPAAALREREPADMVHVFTLHHAGEMLEAVKGYASFGTPVVATAALPRVLNDTLGTPFTLLSGFAIGDETTILDRLELLELHALHAASVESEPRQGYSDAIRALLPHISVVVVNSQTEEDALRNVYRYTGSILRADPTVASAEPEPVAHLTGGRPFTLLHAPIESAANIPLLARAAAECGIPLVACGPTADAVVQRTAAQILGPDFVHIPRPSPGELESLYRTARLFIDVSWMPRGLSRIARAIACGCPVLVSSRSHAGALWPAVSTAAPGSFSEIRDVLARLWAAPQAVPPRPAGDAFFGVVGAYAQAQRAPTGA